MSDDSVARGDSFMDSRPLVSASNETARELSKRHTAEQRPRIHPTRSARAQLLRRGSRSYLAADHAEYPARVRSTTAVTVRIVTTLTNRGMPLPPMTAMAATVHNAASAPTPTETGE